MEKPRSLYEQYAQDIASLGVRGAKRVHEIDKLVDQVRRNSWRRSNLPIKSWRNAVTGNVINDIYDRFGPALDSDEKISGLVESEAHSDRNLACALTKGYVDRSMGIVDRSMDIFIDKTSDTYIQYTCREMSPKVQELYDEFLAQFHLIGENGFSKIYNGISGMKLDVLNLADEIAKHLFDNVKNPLYLQWIQGMESSFKTYVLPQSGHHLDNFVQTNRRILKDPDATKATGFIPGSVAISEYPFSRGGVVINPQIREQLRQENQRVSIRSEKNMCPARLRNALVQGTEEPMNPFSHVIDETYHTMTGMFRRLKLPETT